MMNYVAGVVKQGHRVASGLGEKAPWPEGSIRAQTPFFQELGLDISHFHPATVGVNIEPKTFKILKAQHHFELVDWTDKIPPETFSFLPCELRHAGRNYKGMIYYPHPDTKVMHYHPNSLIEVLCTKIEGLAYGDSIELGYHPGAFEISSTPNTNTGMGEAPGAL